MGIRVIDDTTGLEIPADRVTNFSAQMRITVFPIGTAVFEQSLPNIYIDKAGVDDVLDNPQWQQIYALFTKMLPTVTGAWEAMAADIQRIIVTSTEVSPVSDIPPV